MLRDYNPPVNQKSWKEGLLEPLESRQCPHPDVMGLSLL